MKKLLLPILAAVLAAPLSAKADIIFNGNFNIGAGALNDDIATRQAAGSATSTYSTAGTSGISANALRARNNPTTTNTNFASNIGATNAKSGTFDFTINGLVAQNVIAYDFGAGDTERTLNWTSFSTAVGRWNNVTLEVAAVPEPSSLAILAIASMSVLVRCKRNR